VTRAPPAAIAAISGKVNRIYPNCQRVESCQINRPAPEEGGNSLAVGEAEMGEAARAGSRQARSGMFMAVELFEAEPRAQESVVWLDSFTGRGLRAVRCGKVAQSVLLSAPVSSAEDPGLDSSEDVEPRHV